jgi:hypothetical protein
MIRRSGVRPFLPWFRTGALMGLVGLLAACHQGNIARDTAFNPAGGSAATGAGLVVVGLRVLREPVETTILGDFRTHSIYDIHFREVGGDGNFGRNYREIQICDSVRALLGGVLSDCQPGKLQYQVLSVPPGRYTLESIDYKMGKTRVLTTFNSVANDGFLPPHPVQNPSRSFPVSDGGIVYIGDLNFFFGAGIAPAKMALGRHDYLAAQALAAYPNVKGRLEYHAATGDAPSDPVPGELMPIEGPL